MNVTNFRELNQAEGVMTAFVDVGNSRHVRKLCIVKKHDDCWRWLHDGCKPNKRDRKYCDREAGKLLLK